DFSLAIAVVDGPARPGDSAPDVSRGRGGDGGAVAIGGLDDEQRALIGRVLRLLAPYLRRLEQPTNRLPRGQPMVLVLDLDSVRIRSLLAAAGLTEAELDGVA